MAQAPITLTQNEFLTGITNLALFMRLYATNTSELPAQFVDSFQTETLTNGNTKIYPWAELPTVTDYSETSSLLTVTKVDAGEEFLQITSKKVIKSSYSAYILSMAFTSETGLNDFIGYLLSQMESAKTNFLYNYIVNALFNKTFTGTGQNQQVIQYDLSSVTSFSELNQGELVNQKNIEIAIQQALNNIQHFSTKYSGLGKTQALSLQNLKMIMNEPYHSKNIVNLFATLLNSSVIENTFYKPTMYTIPTDKIPNNKQNVIAWVMHRYAYQIFYKFTFMGSFFDESNLVVNRFLHFWFGEGWLENLPAVLFTANQTPLTRTGTK